MYTGRVRQHEFKTLIYEKELERIAGWVEEYPYLETGGDLFGFWTHSGAPVIQFVLGPGPNSQHNPTSFFQDKEHLIKAGEILRSKHGLQHIGEWHSHHQMGLAEPSQGDENTVFRALERYNFSRFLLGIANLRRRSEGYRQRWTVNIGSFLFTSSRRNAQVGACVVLQGESPIRSNMRGSFRNHDPQLKKSWKVEETTLETQPLVTTEPITISQGLWYATPKGDALLKEIYEKFTAKYGKCQMFRTPQEMMYFTLTIKKQQWQVEFPHDFPDSSPKLKVNSKYCEVKDWRGTYQQFEQIEACIDHYNQKEE